MIASRIADVYACIDAACRRSGRDPNTVRLVVVSKTVNVAAIQMALAAGARILGESYVQEAHTKFQVLGTEPLAWHLVGRLQRNKARAAVRLFDLIHSMDSPKLAAELNRQAAAAGKIQAVLLQINVAGEAAKAGIAPDAAPDLVRTVASLPHLQMKGVMTIPPWFEDAESTRPYFRRLFALYQTLRSQAPDPAEFTEISMGMSGDFEVAIEEGATLVRVGTAIFGERI